MLYMYDAMILFNFKLTIQKPFDVSVLKYSLYLDFTPSNEDLALSLSPNVLDFSMGTGRMYVSLSLYIYIYTVYIHIHIHIHIHMCLTSNSDS